MPTRRWCSPSPGRTPTPTFVPLAMRTEVSRPQAHFFTINDLHARGYVRTFCLCYITPHAGKVLTNFRKLRDRFHKCGAVRCRAPLLMRRQGHQLPQIRGAGCVCFGLGRLAGRPALFHWSLQRSIRHRRDKSQSN